MAEPLSQDWNDVVGRLQVADIVLVRHARGTIERAIRKASGSYWNHAALVFEVLPSEGGKHDVLIIEALPEGVGIHRLRKYSDEPHRYDVGVKRMPGLSEEERLRIRTFFLDVIDTKYNFPLLIAYLFRSAIAKLFGVKGVDYIKKRIIKPDQFVCTSFAQRAFYLGLPEARRDTAFFRDDRDLSFLDRLVAITPGDIARSRNTEWLYNPHD